MTTELRAALLDDKQGEYNTAISQIAAKHLDHNPNDVPGGEPWYQAAILAQRTHLRYTFKSANHPMWGLSGSDRCDQCVDEFREWNERRNK